MYFHSLGWLVHQFREESPVVEALLGYLVDTTPFIYIYIVPYSPYKVRVDITQK